MKKLKNKILTCIYYIIFIIIQIHSYSFTKLTFNFKFKMAPISFMENKILFFISLISKDIYIHYNKDILDCIYLIFAKYKYIIINLDSKLHISNDNNSIFYHYRNGLKICELIQYIYWTKKYNFVTDKYIEKIINENNIYQILNFLCYCNNHLAITNNMIKVANFINEINISIKYLSLNDKILHNINKFYFKTFYSNNYNFNEIYINDWYNNKYDIYKDLYTLFSNEIEYYLALCQFNINNIESKDKYYFYYKKINIDKKFVENKKNINKIINLELLNKFHYFNLIPIVANDIICYSKNSALSIDTTHMKDFTNYKLNNVYNLIYEKINFNSKFLISKFESNSLLYNELIKILFNTYIYSMRNNTILNNLNNLHNINVQSIYNCYLEIDETYDSNTYLKYAEGFFAHIYMSDYWSIFKFEIINNKILECIDCTLLHNFINNVDLCILCKNYIVESKNIFRFDEFIQFVYNLAIADTNVYFIYIYMIYYDYINRNNKIYELNIKHKKYYLLYDEYTLDNIIHINDINNIHLYNNFADKKLENKIQSWCCLYNKCIELEKKYDIRQILCNNYMINNYIKILFNLDCPEIVFDSNIYLNDDYINSFLNEIVKIINKYFYVNMKFTDINKDIFLHIHNYLNLFYICKKTNLNDKIFSYKQILSNFDNHDFIKKQLISLYIMLL